MPNQNPYDRAHELARSIINSEVYHRYVAAKKELEKDPENEQKILAFRNKQMELNQAHLLGQEVSPEKTREVGREFAELNQDKLIAEFFAAEGAFIRMFTDVQQIIQKAIENGFSS